MNGAPAGPCGGDGWMLKSCCVGRCINCCCWPTDAAAAADAAVAGATPVAPEPGCCCW